MLEQLIKKLLENGLYQNGEQPDTVLEQGITVDDIEVDGDSIQFNPDTTSKISGNCTIHGSDTEDEQISINGKFSIDIDLNNSIEISYGDFM